MPKTEPSRWYAALWGPGDRQVDGSATTPGASGRGPAFKKLEFHAEGRAELESYLTAFLAIADKDPDFYIVVRRAVTGRRAPPPATIGDVAEFRNGGGP